jgi:hypothetical protein
MYMLLMVLLLYQGTSGNPAVSSETANVSDSVVRQESGPSSSCVECPQYTNVQVLDHARKVLDQSSEYILAIDRSTPEHFWLGVTSFYKGAIAKPQKVMRPLAVTFVNTGELGSDAGALKREFF